MKAIVEAVLKALDGLHDLWDRAVDWAIEVLAEAEER